MQATKTPNISIPNNRIPNSQHIAAVHKYRTGCLKKYIFLRQFFFRSNQGFAATVVYGPWLAITNYAEIENTIEASAAPWQMEGKMVLIVF